MYDDIVIGRNEIFTSDCKKTGCNNNVLIAGGAGSGKTMSVTEPQLIRTFHSNLIVTVTKRKVVYKYTPLLRKRGYKVLDMNFANPRESNVTYDPLAYIKDTSDIRFVAEALVMANPKKKKDNVADPYWDMASVSLLCAEIAYVMEENPNATFADVINLHRSIRIEEGVIISTNIDDKFERLERKNPMSYAVATWKTFRQLPPRTASCIYSTLNAAIDAIFSDALLYMIANSPRIDIDSLACEKSVLFISTSPVNPTLNCYVDMFYGQLIKSLFEYAEHQSSGQLPIPVRMICDDFATGSRILNFPEYISIFREKRISVTILLQSLSQLEAMYGTCDATTIINNCDTFVYLGSMDMGTARMVSERANVPLEEVLYMPIGDEIVFRRGMKPVFTKRYDTPNDPTYIEITKQFDFDKVA